ncbi:P-selectin glycoprotein ligand 1 [Rhineura floridana]|uniref:P-selectin glycoprotein ligand 1 n=1 Tax=Rhineura floridana TaxID=261503 RepID=UPI002AC87A2D|nr:P-selectin glycoprotein ligand 1 [Rhineura floridana]
MAPLWLSLLMVLWSLLITVGSYKLPTLRLPLQDGPGGEDVESYSVLANPGALSAAPGQWEWKAEDVGQESPQLPRRKREDGMVSKLSPVAAAAQSKKDASVMETTAVGTIYSGAITEISTNATATLDKFGKISTEGDATTKVSTMVSQDSSETTLAGTERVTTALRETANVSGVSEVRWPWLDDISTHQSSVASSEVPTGTLRQRFDTTGPDFKAKGRAKFPPTAAKSSPTTGWLWLDDVSTHQSLVASSEVPTATLRQSFDTTGPNIIQKDKSGFPTAVTTTQGKLPSAKSPSGTATLIGKCLLGIFLLALVAGIFIVIAAVLATMLWRQKRAYKMSQRNQTEMVCISSLLAAEEAEEARGKHPRVKRVKMLGENGSEMDMDNLTLNSFLPEH